jgi:uncharacterized protein (DUF2267 family)
MIMTPHFEHHAAVANQVVNEMARELGCPDDKARAWRTLQAVLHALRNQLTTEESIQLIAQLPMMLKAAYVTNWRLSRKKRRIHRVEDFLSDVLAEDGQTAFHDFRNGEISRMVGATFRVLGRHISPGEAEDILAVLPKELKSFVQPNLLASEAS